MLAFDPFQAEERRALARAILAKFCLQTKFVGLNPIVQF